VIDVFRRIDLGTRDTGQFSQVRLAGPQVLPGAVI